MRCSLVFLLLAGSLTLAAAQSNAQTPTSSGTPALLSTGELAAVEAREHVPALCVQKIVARTANPAAPDTLPFSSDQLCSAYLVLSSPQYQSAQKGARGAFMKKVMDQITTIAGDPAKREAAVQNLTKVYKTLSQQEGSGAGTSGSTNLVSKGAAAEILSLASEYGALAESTSGQTTTVTGSLAGVPLLLLDRGILQLCPAAIYGIFSQYSACTPPKLVQTLSNISYSVSFNTSTNTQTATGTVTGTGTTALPATWQGDC